MDIANEKLSLINQLILVENEDFIARLKREFEYFFQFNEVDYLDEDLPDDLKESIETSLEQYEKGQVFSNEEVVSKFKTAYGL